MSLKKFLRPESVLSVQLSRFGLNPEDWSVRRKDQDSYMVVSRSDQQALFIGKTRQRKPYPEWISLSLVELTSNS